MDAVNVSYVAFTRAERELLVFAQAPSSPKTEASSVSGLLYRHLRSELVDNVYESGSWTFQSYGRDAGCAYDDSVGVLPSVPVGNRLQLSFPSGEFFPEDGSRLRGIVLHDIMSRVEVAEDLDSSLGRAVAAGLLAERDEADVRAHLSGMLESVRPLHWFDGTYSVMTEMPIIAPGGDSYRPDRIMYAGDEAIVVDYKFGKVRSSQYRRQVLGYMNLLGTMGFTSVKGFLWYDNHGLEPLQ